MRLLIAIFFLGFMGGAAQALPAGADKWEAECNNGNARSCYFQAIRIMNGDQIAKDSRKGATFAVKACNLRIADACFMVGNLFYRGASDFPKNKKQSFPFMNAACSYNLHKKNACYYAAKALLDTGGDVQAGIKLADKGCANNDAYACTIIAEGYKNGKYGLSKDNVKLLPFAIKGCDLDNKWSCFVAGDLLTGRNDGVKRNGPLALKLLDKSCRLKKYAACHNAGVQISSGNDLGDDFSKAANYFALACNGGVDSSCYSAGLLKLMDNKEQEALPFLVKVCQQGTNMEACRSAGIATVNFKGESQSRPWFNKACQAGDKPSCDYIKDLDRYERELADYNRKIEALRKKKEAEARKVTVSLNAGDYNGAMTYATYGIGSREQVARIILAANKVGTLSQIDPFYYTFLEMWLSMDHPQANAIVRRERLKNPDGVRAQAQNNRKAPVYIAGPRAPSTMYDQTQKMLDDTYRRNLEWANRGGKPAGFEVRR